MSETREEQRPDIPPLSGIARRLEAVALATERATAAARGGWVSPRQVAGELGDGEASWWPVWRELEYLQFLGVVEMCEGYQRQVRRLAP